MFWSWCRKLSKKTLCILCRTLEEDEFGWDLWQCKERKRICTSWKLWLINGVLPGGDTADSETLPISQRPGCQRQMATGKTHSSIQWVRAVLHYTWEPRVGKLVGGFVNSSYLSKYWNILIYI